MNSKTDIAWAAGFIDGEGCFTMANTTKAIPRIEVGQLDDTPLHQLKRMFGGNVGSPRARDGLRRWVIYGIAAVEVAEAIRPYVKVKGPAADIFIEFGKVKAKCGRGHGNPVEHARRRELYDRLKTFNSHRD